MTVLARRPGAERDVPTAHAIRDLDKAQADFEDAEAWYSACVHARAKAAHVARLRTDLTWPAIGAHLGGMAANTAQMLVSRYLDAITHGTVLHIRRRPSP